MVDRAVKFLFLAAGVAASMALIIGVSAPVARAVGGYTFVKLATLGDPAPKGGFHVNDFEPQDINDVGEVMFASDMSTGGEGVFVRQGNATTEIMRSGDPAPGGLTFGGFGIFSYGALSSNYSAFAFGTDPTDWTKPLGYDATVVRWRRTTGALSAIMVPHVTNAPVGGGKFRGTFFSVDVNSIGEVAFTGIIDSMHGRCCGLGLGIFRADQAGKITNVASPGDAVPGGGVFDANWDTSINTRGDVVFGAHVAGDDCGFDDPSALNCFDSTFVRRAVGPRYAWSPPKLGPIQKIARQGDAAPGGGTFDFAWGGRLNDTGDVVYIGWLEGGDTGVFVNRQGANTAVARNGGAAPGGGQYKSFACNAGSYGMNNTGQIAFGAVLDQDANDDSVDDTGLFIASSSGTQLVARTGTVLPGIGTVVHVGYPAACSAGVGGMINSSGQTLFQVILDNGDNVLLVAKP